MKVPPLTVEERAVIRDLIMEVPMKMKSSYTMPAPTYYTAARVDFYAETPRGSRTRFQRVIPFNQLRGAKSETAMYFYLKRIHRGCDIIIIDMEYQ